MSAPVPTNRSRARAAAVLPAGALALALSAAGCAEVQYRERGVWDVIRRRGSADTPEEAFGHQATVRTNDTIYHGELIGCDGERIYLLLNSLEAAPYESVRWAVATSLRVRRPSQGPAYLAWTLLGTASSISHGWFAFLTVPLVWGVTGGISTGFAWNPGVEVASCEGATPFARFPQGLPEGFAERYFGVGPREGSGGARRDEVVLPPIEIAP